MYDMSSRSSATSDWQSNDPNDPHMAPCQSHYFRYPQPPKMIHHFRLVNCPNSFIVITVSVHIYIYANGDYMGIQRT